MVLADIQLLCFQSSTVAQIFQHYNTGDIVRTVDSPFPLIFG
jgi:hypothetical protein